VVARMAHNHEVESSILSFATNLLRVKVLLNLGVS
jgi:hypothetical protein